MQHLLLVSPAGVGRRPSEWEPSSMPSAWSLRGALARFLIWSWDSDLTPGRVIRGLGPLGPGLVQRYARGRFQQGLALSDAEVARFESYFYHILVARGSGEFALRHILAPFAWPRQALEERCADLQVPVTIFYGTVLKMEGEGEGAKTCPMAGWRTPVAYSSGNTTTSSWQENLSKSMQFCPQTQSSETLNPLPPSFFPGDVDWMEPRSGGRYGAMLREKRGVLAEHDTETITTPKAGHYLFMDNPSAFLRQVAEVTRQYLPADALQRLLEAAAQAGAPLGTPFHPPDALEEQPEREASFASEGGRPNTEPHTAPQ